MPDDPDRQPVRDSASPTSSRAGRCGSRGGGDGLHRACRPRDRAGAGRRRGHGDRLLRGRRLQRGPQRRSAGDGARFRARWRHERNPRVLGLPARSGRRRASARGGANAANLPRTRERAPLRLRRRRRARRRADPADGRPRPAGGREAAGRRRLRLDGAADARRDARPLRPGARDRGRGARRVRARRQCRPVHLPGAAAAAAAPRRQHRGGLDLLAPRSLRARSLPGRCATWSRAGPGCRSSSCTTQTGSGSAATRRCRSSSTARIWETRPSSSSRPSGTRSRCYSWSGADYARRTTASLTATEAACSACSRSRARSRYDVRKAVDNGVGLLGAGETQILRRPPPRLVEAGSRRARRSRRPIVPTNTSTA